MRNGGVKESHSFFLDGTAASGGFHDVDLKKWQTKEKLQMKAK